MELIEIDPPLTKVELAAIENHAQLVRFVVRGEMNSAQSAALAKAHAIALFDNPAAELIKYELALSALDEIAAWDEPVDSAFDPGTHGLARDTLRRIRGGDGRP